MGFVWFVCVYLFIYVLLAVSPVGNPRWENVRAKDEPQCCGIFQKRIWPPSFVWCRPYSRAQCTSDGRSYIWEPRGVRFSIPNSALLDSWWIYSAAKVTVNIGWFLLDCYTAQTWKSIRNGLSWVNGDYLSIFKWTVWSREKLTWIILGICGIVIVSQWVASGYSESASVAFGGVCA